MTAAYIGKRIAVLEKFSVAEWVRVVKTYRIRRCGLPAAGQLPGLDAPAPAELLELVRCGLPRHCVPVAVVMVDELPRTASLKVSLGDVADTYSG